MVGDPIADMITRIKNAAVSGKDSVSVPFSKIKLEIANLLKAEGYLSAVESSGNDKIASARQIKMDLVRVASTNGAVGIKKARISGTERVSKPSRRIYVTAQAIKDGARHATSGKGILVLSTTAGIITGKAAVEKGLGGEALFKIW
ncbi:MAG TPA: 30S ribosomal protein S8 [Candidatus Paceibacterota bacterium]|nr:30S ribosomal protein S8 [Candidatus Paceibacterota bacterium]